MQWFGLPEQCLAFCHVDSHLDHVAAVIGAGGLRSGLIARLPVKGGLGRGKEEGYRGDILRLPRAIADGDLKVAAGKG